jgi:ABC-2 type transport system permease protein
VFHYEYRMSIRRWGVLAVFALGYLLYFFFFFKAVDTVEVSSRLNMSSFSDVELWQSVALSFFRYNVLLPVVGGIAVADRLVRDNKLGVQELLQSTCVSRRSLILGKYFGALASLLVLASGLMLLESLATIFIFHASWKILYICPVVFIAITVPTYAFITAFSLACPVVIPLRIYQVLFTGYWFWGNFLSPQAFPSWSGTLLNASGVYAMGGFFKAGYISNGVAVLTTPLEAVLNLLVLAGLTILALVGLNLYVKWQAHHD